LKNIPTFRRKDGKYLSKREHVEVLTNAVYKDQDEVFIGDQRVEILSSVRTNESWEVTVEVHDGYNPQ